MSTWFKRLLLFGIFVAGFVVGVVAMVAVVVLVPWSWWSW